MSGRLTVSWYRESHVTSSRSRSVVPLLEFLGIPGLVTTLGVLAHLRGELRSDRISVVVPGLPDVGHDRRDVGILLERLGRHGLVVDHVLHLDPSLEAMAEDTSESFRASHHPSTLVERGINRGEPRDHWIGGIPCSGRRASCRERAVHESNLLDDALVAVPRRRGDEPGPSRWLGQEIGSLRTRLGPGGDPVEEQEARAVASSDQLE